MKKIISGLGIGILLLIICKVNASYIFTFDLLGELSFVINSVAGSIIGTIGMITWFKLNRIK